MKITGEQSTVFRFLGFSRNVSGQKLLVYHILILIHRGAKFTGVPDRLSSLLKTQNDINFGLAKTSVKP